MSFSIGYMVWDNWSMVYIGLEPISVFIFHHFLAGGTLVYTVFFRPEGTWFTNVIFLTEFVCPFNFFTWALETLEGITDRKVADGSRGFRLVYYAGCEPTSPRPCPPGVSSGRRVPSPLANATRPIPTSRTRCSGRASSCGLCSAPPSSTPSLRRRCE